MSTYREIGRLKNGESVFVDKEGNVFVEKDFSYLVEPTDAEAEEIEEILEAKEAEKEACEAEWGGNWPDRI